MHKTFPIHEIDGLVQNCNISIASTLEISQSCTMPLKRWCSMTIQWSMVGCIESFNCCYAFFHWLNEQMRLNTLRPRWNGSHFAVNIFNCIFLNENVWISIKISLKFVPKSPINNIPALVQIMIRLPTHVCITLPQWIDSLRPIVWSHMVKGILVRINSGNGLLPDWCQAITWINAVLLSQGHSVTNFSRTSFKNNKKKIYEETVLENATCKMSSILFRPQYVSENGNLLNFCVHSFTGSRTELKFGDTLTDTH